MPCWVIDASIACLEVVDVVGDEVRQVGVLRVVPALLDGVQFGGIRRKRLEGKPIGMVLFEVRRRRSMHVPAIPDHDHMTAVMMVQEPKQPDQLVRIDVLRHEVEVKR